MFVFFVCLFVNKHKHNLPNSISKNYDFRFITQHS